MDRLFYKKIDFFAEFDGKSLTLQTTDYKTTFLCEKTLKDNQ